ncbi:MAG: segregation/condensation protein A [Ruminiclostridium sp.]|nr:segregation/condensation protein A [Ruminiclostridium sp.]MBQ8931317.1 segregation/condensation protein A [Ruminiclostridium sp.]
MSTELNFKLEVFEGPLDLMLSLIAKHKLNIYDIEISLLLEQFMLYLEQMKQADIEIAGEFMEMAARLIYIKSAALLPKHEAEELKKELQGVLIEYAMCKKIAGRLQESFCGDLIFVRSPVELDEDKSYNNEHDPDELLLAMSNISFKEVIRKTPPSMKPIVAKSFVTVFTKIVHVLKIVMNGGEVKVKSLYKGQKRSEQVATFLALLELSKNSRIKFSEDNRYLHFVPRNKIDEEFNFVDDYTEEATATE